MDTASIINNNPKIKLNNGQSIPQLGLGVYKLGTDTAESLILNSFEAGYRRIDTAAFYQNEVEVGRAVRNSGLNREDIFVTTKVWNDNHGYDQALKAIDASLQLLDIDYIDMLLIHWPSPKLNKFVETWDAFQAAQAGGKVHGIGVSNFEPAHLEKLLAAGGTVPALNQVELHPGLQQAELRAFNAKHGIATEAWSPLARGKYNEDPIITAISAKHNRSVTQIIVRWHIQLGNLVIPKTSSPVRLQENISVFDFELDSDDMSKMAGLETGFRTGPHPNDV